MERYVDELMRRLRSQMDEDDFDYITKDANLKKDCNITKKTTGLDSYIVIPNNPSVGPKLKRLVHTMNTYADEKYEVIKLNTSVLPEKKSSTTLFHKNTECKFICDSRAIVVNDSNETELNVGIKYRDSFYHLESEDSRFPIEILFATDNESYKMFQTYDSVEEKYMAIKPYSELTASQRLFFRTQFNRPKCDDTSDEDIYTPIRDEKALRVLYETCKYTYSPKIRAKIKLLFSELDSHPSNSDRINLINQISHIIGVDTQLYPYHKKSYQEIIAIMNKYIYGLESFKESFAEFLLTMQFSGCNNYTALFIGPPGVGKTSWGEIIAECCEKPFIFIDCAGANVLSMSGLVKSYSAAKAGKISDAYWETGRTDAVVMFDEIDKLEQSKDGDPYSVFLKALGPQKLLYDEFVDEDIDVSNSIFIFTANDITKIPQYIINRFGSNIFYLDKYTLDEKVAIARRHLIPSILKKIKISPEDMVITDDALMLIAHEYTKDDGVREMESYIETLARKVVRIFSENENTGRITVDETFVRKHLKKMKTSQNDSRKMGF